MIVLEWDKWTPIESRLRVEWAHKPSVFLMRSVMKRELGFTVRKDTKYNNSTYKMITTVHLDFFDAPAETMFRLRYL
jgi:hypothetical protein